MNRLVSSPHVGPAVALNPPGDKLAAHVLGIGPDVPPDDVGPDPLRLIDPAAPLSTERLYYADPTGPAVPAPVPAVDMPVTGLPLVGLHTLLRTFHEMCALAGTDIDLSAIVHAPPDDYGAIADGLRSAGADAVHCEPSRGGNRIAFDITVHVDRTPDA